MKITMDMENHGKTMTLEELPLGSFFSIKDVPHSLLIKIENFDSAQSLFTGAYSIRVLQYDYAGSKWDTNALDFETEVEELPMFFDVR